MKKITNKKKLVKKIKYTPSKKKTIQKKDKNLKKTLKNKKFEKQKILKHSKKIPDEFLEQNDEFEKSTRLDLKKKEEEKEEFRPAKSKSEEKTMLTYSFESGSIPIKISIEKKVGEFVLHYNLEISVISKTTELILERIRQELIKKVSLGIVDLSDIKKTNLVEEKFEELIDILIQKYFPDSNDETSNFLRTYLKMKSLGLGSLELLMSDVNLEEIVINQASEPAWVYHKKFGWLKTNVYLKNEEQIRHYASIIGRKVGRQITVLTPLLDAHLDGGDRVNATLNPVSTAGNTITIRKFSKDPWTITKFLKTNTITAEAAALIWTAIQYEMSALIAGGTASGKTSALNVFANFFPPNQRIISIEDTREITLPKFLHWVPLNTVLPNAEGKGSITMEDLLVNSLRMRPDRILVGEVRRKNETETLFEAIHTGHSVYATFHANSARETVERLTNPPINVPRMMLPSISLIIVQFRNRRTGNRRTFQIAAIQPDGSAHVLMQYNSKKDKLEYHQNTVDEFMMTDDSNTLFTSIELFTGMTTPEIKKDLAEKVTILEYLVKKNIDDVDGVGRIMAEYYTNKENLLEIVKTNKDLPQ